MRRDWMEAGLALIYVHLDVQVHLVIILDIVLTQPPTLIGTVDHSLHSEESMC